MTSNSVQTNIQNILFSVGNSTDQVSSPIKTKALKIVESYLGPKLGVIWPYHKKERDDRNIRTKNAGKLNMVHRKISPWKRRSRTWKLRFCGSMLNFWGCTPCTNTHTKKLTSFYYESQQFVKYTQQHLHKGMGFYQLPIAHPWNWHLVTNSL